MCPRSKRPAPEGAPRSLRERMEVHRAEPACASCHLRMDPLGFALENFDAVGMWRTMSDGAPIDASASLPDGTRFDGLDRVCATLLVSHQEDFVRTLSGKLLAYAIGRGLDHYDLARGPEDRARRRGARLQLVLDHFAGSSRARRSAWGLFRAIGTSDDRRRWAPIRIRLKEERPCSSRKGDPAPHGFARPGRRRSPCRCSTAWSRRFRRS